MTISECHPGQVILLTRWHTFLASALVFFGALAVGQLGLGVLLLAFAFLLEPDAIEAGIAMSLMGLLGSALFLGTACHLLTHKRWLVLCSDRMQYRVGKRVRWEVEYRDIAGVALFRDLLGRPYLGVRLWAPERFDRAWPRVARQRVLWQHWGFHLALPTAAAAEPPERVLETSLRLLQLFRAEVGDGATE
jgi:hypothetical protein